EFPAIPCGGGFAQCFQIGTVQDVNAQDRENEVMKGGFRNIAWRLRRIAGRFPYKQSDIAFLQPRDARIVESSCLVVCPWSGLGSASPFPPPDNEGVAGR